VVRSRMTELAAQAAAKSAGDGRSLSRRPLLTNVLLDNWSPPAGWPVQAIGRFIPSCRELRKRHGSPSEYETGSRCLGCLRCLKCLGCWCF
jgi:hypothetical protein